MKNLRVKNHRYYTKIYLRKIWHNLGDAFGQIKQRQQSNNPLVSWKTIKVALSKINTKPITYTQTLTHYVKTTPEKKTTPV